MNEDALKDMLSIKLGIIRERIEARAASLPGLRVRGLMTMARPSGDPEASRPVFRLLREIMADIRAQGIVDETFCELSMGMSRDYEIAAGEGATILRVGTAVFEGLS